MGELVASVLHRLGRSTKRPGRALPLPAVGAEQDSSILGFVELNEIGKLRLRLSTPLLVDQYRRNRATGSFVLIDESTNDTVGAGMVL